MKNTFRILAALVATLVIAGCGQSGPLYLPGDPSEVQNLPTQLPETTEQANEEDEAEKKDDGGG